MVTKKSTKRQPVKKNTKATKPVDDVGEDSENLVTSEAIEQSKAEEKKKVVAGKGRGKGKAVVPDVEDTVVDEEDANGEQIAQAKGRKKKVTFRIWSGNSKGNGKAVDEEERNEASGEGEDDIETDEEEEDVIEEDHVDVAGKTAVNVGRKAPQKKTVGKPTEVSKDCPLEPEPLRMVKQKSEVGEGSKKRKGDESSIVVA